jgi:Fe-S-cluster-containing hydrogenase component 2
MRYCPTKAIRVRDGLAVISKEFCIDCGECLRVCEHGAIVPITTAPADLNKFAFKVAVPSPVLFTQFGQNIMPDQILSALRIIGFDYVYDEAWMCEMASMAIEKYLTEKPKHLPIISSTCPVVVRLIQRLFPSLCDLIIPIEPPREIAAKTLRKQLSKKHGLKKNDIGIFHITPCSAKLVSINHPETMKYSHLDGAMSIQEIFNRTMMILKKTTGPHLMDIQNRISGIGIGWAISGGEIRGLKSSLSVSVSGVHDTIRILEDVEAGKLKNIEYLECLICPDGCIGGPLTVENRFLAKSAALRLIRTFGGKKKVDEQLFKKLYDQGFFSFEVGIRPKPFPALDKSRGKAIKKIQKLEQIFKQLPKIDCGLCGSPDCKTFAEDVVRNNARPEKCSFLNKARRGKNEK